MKQFKAMAHALQVEQSREQQGDQMIAARLGHLHPFFVWSSDGSKMPVYKRVCQYILKVSAPATAPQQGPSPRTTVSWNSASHPRPAGESATGGREPHGGSSSQQTAPWRLAWTEGQTSASEVKEAGAESTQRAGAESATGAATSGTSGSTRRLGDENRTPAISWSVSWGTSKST